MAIKETVQKESQGDEVSVGREQWRAARSWQSFSGEKPNSRLSGLHDCVHDHEIHGAVGREIRRRRC